MNGVLDFLVNQCHAYFDTFENVCVFGSSLWSDTPGDIDILLVYEDSKLPLVQSAEVCIVDRLSKQFYGMVIHLTTLSQSELGSTDFLNQITYVKIK